MPKFLQVRTAGENIPYYINVEMVRYVLQNTQHADRSSVQFDGDHGDPHMMCIGESAASFVTRAGTDRSWSASPSGNALPANSELRRRVRSKTKAEGAQSPI